MELAALEKTVLAFEPMRRMVPITTTKITASITAYSAMSYPLSSAKIWEDIHLPATPSNREMSDFQLGTVSAAGAPHG